MLIAKCVIIIQLVSNAKCCMHVLKVIYDFQYDCISVF